MYRMILLLLFCGLDASIEDKEVVFLPSSISIGLQKSEYSYRIMWVHEHNFNIVCQYKNNQLSDAFVLYSGKMKLKPGQVLTIKSNTQFIKVGLATYYNGRYLHILCPIVDLKLIDETYNNLQPLIREFYGY